MIASAARRFDHARPCRGSLGLRFRSSLLLAGVVIDQFQHGNLSTVAVTLSEFYDTRVSARACSNLGGNFIKECGHRFPITEERKDLTPGVYVFRLSVCFFQNGILRARDELLHDHASFLRLCGRRANFLMHDQGNTQCGERRLAVASGSSKLSA